jgi:uncharacterized LabA/DUF88 family protein
MPSLLHKQRNFAVLIDAENAQHTLTRPILLRAACYGVLAVKRAYADWSRPGMRRFKQLLHRNAVEAVHLFDCATGKNAADMALSLDAMDLLHMGQLDGFCIVSSDSDFTPLAMRIRRDGLRVYGFGGRQTPKAFVAACNCFIYTDTIRV